MVRPFEKGPRSNTETSAAAGRHGPPLSAMGIDQTGAREVRMVRALHRAAVFTANINSPPDLSHHIELGQLTLTPGGRTHHRVRRVDEPRHTLGPPIGRPPPYRPRPGGLADYGSRPKACPE